MRYLVTEGAGSGSSFGVCPPSSELLLEDIEIAVFDLDGTLIIQDSLYEQLKVIFEFSKIIFLSSLITLIAEGRVCFKKRVFHIIEEYDCHHSTLNKISVNEMVQREFYRYKNNGITVIVATAAYWKTTLKVLQKIRILPDVLVSTGNKHNLKGKMKLKYLLPHVTDAKWVYYADSKSDVPLFKAANKSYKVTSNSIERVGL